MRPPRLPYRRIALCIALGAVTSWLVAWGLTIAAWSGWFRDARWVPASEEPSFSTDGRRVFLRSGWRTPCYTYHGWSVTRLDRDDNLRSLSAQARLATWTGRAWQPPEGVRMPFLCGFTPSLTPKHDDAILSEFNRAGLQAMLDESTSVAIECYSTGWPSPCLLRALVEQDSVPAMAPIWSWSVNELQAESSWEGMLEPLRLPLRPLFPGLLLNTTFYALLWSLPLFTLPLLKKRRRRRGGHCPRCNYDLKGALDQGCPECGWKRRASSAIE